MQRKQLWISDSNDSITTQRFTGEILAQNENWTDKNKMPQSSSELGPILVAGLSPAWQKTLTFGTFMLGSVNRALKSQWSASGKVLNAAVAVAELGEPCVTVAPLGGAGLEAIDAEFRSRAIAHRWIKTQAATRVCTTIIEENTNQMTEAVEEGTPLTGQELAAFEDVFREEAQKAAVIILIGSLPQGTPDEFYRQLARHAKSPLILDFRGPGLIQTLSLKPFVIKPNREELEETVGRPLENRDAVIAAMRELNGRGATWVVVTDGSRPVLATSNEEVIEIDPIRVENAVSPLGCGDAMAAAFAVGIRRGQPFETAFRLGVAAAAVNLQQRLPCRPLDRRRIEALAANT